MDLDLSTEARLNQARLYVHAIVDVSTVRAARWIADSLYYARRACGVEPTYDRNAPLNRLVSDCDYIDSEAFKIWYETHR